MGEIIQQIMLSDLMIFVLTGAVGLGITIWALSRQEYAGYILGWLTGIFLILLLSSLVPWTQPSVGVTTGEPQPLSFLAVFFPGMIGLFVGVIIPMVIYRVGNAAPGRVRALIVAALLSMTLVTGYGMLLMTYSVRLTMGVFVLTVAIGALLHFIVISRYSRPVVVVPPVTVTPASEIPPIPVGVEVPAADASAANRIQAIRQQFDAQFEPNKPPAQPLNY